MYKNIRLMIVNLAGTLDLRPVLFPIEVTSDQLEEVDKQISEKYQPLY